MAAQPAFTTRGQHAAAAPLRFDAECALCRIRFSLKRQLSVARLTRLLVTSARGECTVTGGLVHGERWASASSRALVRP